MLMSMRFTNKQNEIIVHLIYCKYKYGKSEPCTERESLSNMVWILNMINYW